MHKTLVMTAILLMVSGCAPHLEKAKPCTGSLVKGCVPTIYFDFDRSTLSEESQKDLDGWTMDKMNRWPTREMHIIGFADSKGSSEYNMKLAKKRANRVRDYLISKGLDSKRITVESRGNNDLLTEDAAHQDLNRRVEIHMYFPKRFGIF